MQHGHLSSFKKFIIQLSKRIFKTLSIHHLHKVSTQSIKSSILRIIRSPHKKANAADTFNCTLAILFALLDPHQDGCGECLDAFYHFMVRYCLGNDSASPPPPAFVEFMTTSGLYHPQEGQ
jgi:hypothetical protein